MYIPEKPRAVTWVLTLVRRTGRAALTEAEPIIEAILGTIMRADIVMVCVWYREEMLMMD